MKAEITEDQFREYIVAQLKKYAWRLAREGKLSWIDRSDNSDFAVVKNHATCDMSLTYHGKNVECPVEISQAQSWARGLE